jgi:hypothetical protein
MTMQVNEVLVKHRLNIHVLPYFKDEGSNLATMIYVVSCEVLGLLAPFVGSRWGQAMSKCS